LRNAGSRSRNCASSDEIASCVFHGLGGLILRRARGSHKIRHFSERETDEEFVALSDVKLARLEGRL
jgi:hypothetical protein